MALPSARERFYDLIKRPLMTEKSTVLQGLRNQYTFEVANHANKSEIKKAVEALFDVHVERVCVANLPGKMRRILGRPGKTSDWRKAVVTLREGEALEVV